MVLTTTTDLVVRSLSRSRSRGVATIGGLTMACALGRTGQCHRKREGDGASPIGAWELVRVLYRADRVRRPRTALPCRPISPRMGWCDAPFDRNYNRPVRHPYPASAEHLWRDDGLYDIVVVTSHNARPRIHGGGSAIFLHHTRADYAPTAGCLALSADDLLRVLSIATTGSRLVFAG